MKIDIGRNGPAAFRCDIYLEGEDDPPYVRIHRGGTVVAEIACNAVSDDETMAREVGIARRMEAFPSRFNAVLVEMTGDYAGFSSEGSTPERRRQDYSGGFVAGIVNEVPQKCMSQNWLLGFKAGRMISKEIGDLVAAWGEIKVPINYKPIKDLTYLERPVRPSK